MSPWVDLMFFFLMRYAYRWYTWSRQLNWEFRPKNRSPLPRRQAIALNFRNLGGVGPVVCEVGFLVNFKNSLVFQLAGTILYYTECIMYIYIYLYSTCIYVYMPYSLRVGEHFVCRLIWLNRLCLKNCLLISESSSQSRSWRVPNRRALVGLAILGRDFFESKETSYKNHFWIVNPVLAAQTPFNIKNRKATINHSKLNKYTTTATTQNLTKSDLNKNRIRMYTVKPQKDPTKRTDTSFQPPFRTPFNGALNSTHRATGAGCAYFLRHSDFLGALGSLQGALRAAAGRSQCFFFCWCFVSCFFCFLCCFCWCFVSCFFLCCFVCFAFGVFLVLFCLSFSSNKRCYTWYT